MKAHVKQTKRYTRSTGGNLFFFLLVTAMGLFTILPLIYCITTSFKPLEELMLFPPRLFTVRRPTLANYSALPSLLSSLSVPISRYVFNSVFVAAVTTLLHILVASMAAYVFLMKQYMDDSVPAALLEAARIDGAGNFTIYLRIVMPLVKPAWLTLTLFAFRDMWSVQPTGTIFSEEMKTLPYVLSQVVSGGLARAGSAMAVTVLLMIPPVIVYLVSQSHVMETMGSAGIKD